MIRTQVAPETIVPALRRVLHAADPALPLVSVRTQQAQIDEDLADERLLVSLSSIFGVLALVLASVGIYGVMALSVAQRTREIGIRMALGAIPRQILAMVLREASSLSVIAIAIGVGASFLVTRFVKSMLFGIASIRSGHAVGRGSAADDRRRWAQAGYLHVARRACIRWRRFDGTDRGALKSDQQSDLARMNHGRHTVSLISSVQQYGWRSGKRGST